MTTPSRRRAGERLSPLRFTALDDRVVEIPASTLVHLQFRRFAGCPVCNLHLQSFARAEARLRTAGLLTVAFFHSTAEQMRPYQGRLPFPCIPDAERAWYRHFGVERSPLAIAHPRVVWAALRGLVSAPSNPLAGGGDQAGLPADFLLDRTGVLRAVSYGTHANDQWSVEHVLSLARGG